MDNYPLLIVGASSVGVIGALLIALHMKWKFGKIVLPLLSIIVLGAALAGYFASLDDDLWTKDIWIRSAVVLHLLLPLLLLELVVHFLLQGKWAPSISLFSKKLRLTFIWRIGAVFGSVYVAVTPWFFYVQDRSGENVLVFLNVFGQVVFAFLFFYYILAIYYCEKLFRNASLVQKRIFPIFIASVGILSIGSIILIAKVMLYRVISFEVVQIHSALCIVFFPGMLIGLVRYKLWEHQVEVDRGVVYTSVTLLFFSLFLLVLGIVVYIIRLFNMHFDDFKLYVFLFSVLFIGIMAIFSSNARKLVTLFSRNYLYKSKYDYRDQLLRLHEAHQTTGNVEHTIAAYVNNLRYTILVEEAFVFLRSYDMNSYVTIRDLLSSVNKQFTIRANSSLVHLFESDVISAINLTHSLDNTVSAALQYEKQLLEELSISHIFPIKHEGRLLAILGVKAGKRNFDSEDLMLITILCESIGTIIFRDRVQKEYIERMQFESFSHMASFIVHDIKNQVATLSLLTKNAHDNISDPEFHPVLVRSLENCSGNLNNLIAKLQSPPKKESLSIVQCDCNVILSDIIEQTRPSLPTGIVLKSATGELPRVAVDRKALYYVLKNLIINAVEALGSEGVITCTSGSYTMITEEDSCQFSLLSVDKSKFSAYIIVEDNGPGMSPDFMTDRLFKPFNTTKDKGIGIGLYQCKTLIETMNGRLLCSSEEGKGTRFCILLL